MTKRPRFLLSISVAPHGTRCVRSGAIVHRCATRTPIIHPFFNGEGGCGPTTSCEPEVRTSADPILRHRTRSTNPRRRPFPHFPLARYPLCVRCARVAASSMLRRTSARQSRRVACADTTRRHVFHVILTWRSQQLVGRRCFARASVSVRSMAQHALEALS